MINIKDATKIIENMFAGVYYPREFNVPLGIISLKPQKILAIYDNIIDCQYTTVLRYKVTPTKKVLQELIVDWVCGMQKQILKNGCSTSIYWRILPSIENYVDFDTKYRTLIFRGRASIL